MEYQLSKLTEMHVVANNFGVIAFINKYFQNLSFIKQKLCSITR